MKMNRRTVSLNRSTVSYELSLPGNTVTKGFIQDFHPKYPGFPSASWIQLIAYDMAFPDGPYGCANYEAFKPTDEQYQEIFAAHQLATTLQYITTPNPENPDFLCGKPEALLKVPHCHICRGTQGKIHRDALAGKSEYYYALQTPSFTCPGEWITIPMLFCKECGDKVVQSDHPDVIVRDQTPAPENPKHKKAHMCRLQKISFKTSAVVVLFNYAESKFQARIRECISDFVWKPTEAETEAEDAHFAALAEQQRLVEAEEAALMAALEEVPEEAAPEPAHEPVPETTVPEPDQEVSLKSDHDVDLEPDQEATPVTDVEEA